MSSQCDECGEDHERKLYPLTALDIIGIGFQSLASIAGAVASGLGLVSKEFYIAGDYKRAVDQAAAVRQMQLDYLDQFESKEETTP